MTRSEVINKLIGRLIIKDNIEVFLDCQENNGVKSINYKDVNQYSYFGVTGNSWEEVYLQMIDNLKNEGEIK
ncbi:MAG: hypothetical protein IT232_01320 [Flavobacteriales bacterium]|nr:hypothetical protein [Flavobacteriales bacterium]